MAIWRRNLIRWRKSEKLEVFSAELRNLRGFGRWQICGAGFLVEETITQGFCLRLEVQDDEGASTVFADSFMEAEERALSRERGGVLREY
jgi:hypothetical protein